MMKDYIFSLEIKVRDYELDSEGIVNNANYLHYLEYTRHEFCEEAGFSFKAMEEAGYPIAFQAPTPEAPSVAKALAIFLEANKG